MSDADLEEVGLLVTKNVTKMTKNKVDTKSASGTASTARRRGR